MGIKKYLPSKQQIALVEILSQLTSSCRDAKILIYIVGGYGVDGLYGSLTRDHGDIDILIEEKDIKIFRNIIEQMNFIEDITNIDTYKTVYIPNNELALPYTFKIEFGTTSSLNKILPEGVTLRSILPKEDNALLMGFSFKTLTLEGQKIIAEIQHEREIKEKMESV
jgi:hypothetical protein